jgi:protein TonB
LPPPNGNAMTATETPAIEIAPLAEPAARPPLRNDGAWRLWLGWAIAAMLHGGLLAALIFSWPAPLDPAPPNPALVSLLIVAADKPAQRAVRPTSAAEPAFIAVAPPVKIASSTKDTRPKQVFAPPKAAALAHSPPAGAPQRASRGAVVAQQDGDGFIGAHPLAGNVNQPPEYPEAARVHGEQGDVLLSIHVLANGAAGSVSVTQSSGYRDLDEAAAKAVWKWRFQPATRSGRPVPSVIAYRINFSLQDAP